MRFFTPDQRAELTAHLALVIPGAGLIEAVASLDFACAWAASELNPPASIRRRVIEDEARRADQHAHFTAVSSAADTLLELLGAEQQRPLLPAATPEDWSTFYAELAAVSEAAQQAVSQSTERRRPRGARTAHWRDRLIAYAFSVYPTGRASTTAEGHFEQTVRLLLRTLGRETEDVHKAILIARRRMPRPPIAFRAIAKRK